MSDFIRIRILLFVLGVAGTSFSSANSVQVEDIFGRTLNQRAITLVDWEGYLANPAIKLFITPPDNLKYPIRIVLQAPESRAYFDLSSDNYPNQGDEVGIFGPRKVLRLFSKRKVPFYMSIWPDHEAMDRDFPLQITLTQADDQVLYSEVKVHVVDQDKPLASSLFEIHVDFSKDQTGYFSDLARRAPIEKAAKDWSYFFDGSDFDAVKKGEEATLVSGPNGWENPRELINDFDYRGFWLYVLGNYQATGGWSAQSATGFQHKLGQSLPLRRSGALGIETKPAGAADGYLLSYGDWEWWRFIYQTGLPVELYSLAQHELGHSLFVESHYPQFKQWETWPGYVQNAEVLAYQKAYPEIGPGGHLTGTVDRMSRLPAFGSGKTFMPSRRWVTTKLDLLVAQAVGYKLRPTSALKPLTLQGNQTPFTQVGKPLHYSMKAEGGIPFYFWSLNSGTLPEGLSLDSYTGTITGVATKAGVYPFSLSVRDYDEMGIPLIKEVVLTVD